MTKAVAPEHVVWAYRLFLDREPENTAVISSRVDARRTVAQLREELLASPEFRAKNPGLRDLLFDSGNQRTPLLCIPPPNDPRELFNLFLLYDERFGLAHLLKQVGFADETPARIIYSVYGSAGPVPSPQSLEAYSPGEHFRDELQSARFQRDCVKLFLNAFPEKRRLIFVHVPKCAGTDLWAHLSARFPTFDHILTWASWTSKEGLFSGLKEVMQRIGYSSSVFVYGHVRLHDYMAEGLIRPIDRIFTTIRHPTEIVLSLVNYVMTRLLTDQRLGSLRPDTAAWLRMLNVEAMPPPSKDLTRDLCRQILFNEEIVRRNQICYWLGAMDARSALENLIQADVEITDTTRYTKWLSRNWNIASTTRINQSTTFLSRDVLSNEESRHLESLVEEDMKIYSAIVRKLAATGRPSIHGTELIGADTARL